MSITINHIPIPFFQISKDYRIIDKSPPCNHFFNCTKNFLELIDSESLDKFKTYLLEKNFHDSVEINMVTKNNPPTLFRVNASFHVEENQYYIFCQPFHDQYINLQYELFQLKESIVNMDEQAYKNLEQYSLSQSDSTSLEKVIQIDTSKRLDSIRRSTSSIMDLLGVMTNIMIENDKSDYLELVYDELRDIKSLVDEIKSSIN